MGKKESGHDKKGNKKKNTSLRLEGKILKALKILAIQDETSVQQIIEKLVGDYLASRGIKIQNDTEIPQP